MIRVPDRSTRTSLAQSQIPAGDVFSDVAAGLQKSLLVAPV